MLIVTDPAIFLCDKLGNVHRSQLISDIEYIQMADDNQIKLSFPGAQGRWDMILRVTDPPHVARILSCLYADKVI